MITQWFEQFFGHALGDFILFILTVLWVLLMMAVVGLCGQKVFRWME